MAKRANTYRLTLALQALAFLCSDEARWITGQRLEVSGGMNL